jgi:DNA-binding response OmpR family regulator
MSGDSTAERSVLVIGEPGEPVERWRADLEAAGYGIVTSATGDGVDLRLPAVAPEVPDVIVLVARSPASPAWDVLAAVRQAGPGATAPVVVIVAPGALGEGLRGAIDGAVRCLAEPVEASVLVTTLDAVLAPDAPPVPEQQRRARQRALEVLARIEARGATSDDEEHPRLVHLTRLERGPMRSPVPDPLADARRRMATLTAKQRALLALVEAEGGVTAAAARLETSRGNVYAGLRRIVHRLGMRDTGELLRVLGGGELLGSAQS